jgi:arginyl-tRNA synthetase
LSNGTRCVLKHYYQLFYRLYLFHAGNEEVLALWHRFRALSIEAYKKVYKRLNIRFDIYSGESLVAVKSIINAMEILKEKGLLSTKSISESKDSRRKPGSETDAEDTDMNEESNDENGPLSLAWAVDLSKWDLGKPVVEKGGLWFFL